MTWDRVIGQARVKKTLLAALRNNRLPHAYLFVGDDGVGKDAVALELARVLHCEKGGEGACNMCPSCIKMDSMQHPDVSLVVALPVGKGEKSDDPPLEKLTMAEVQLVQEQFKLKARNPYHQITIPKASIIKINSIRHIRRESSLSTTGSFKRIIIISRAEEMGEAAANTLLKTLEEPSGNTMLILTTSHRDGLLPTIISRCQMVQFDPLNEQDLRTALIERNGVDTTQASLVARLAHGSYTKALELLQDDVADRRQQVLAFMRTVLSNNIVALTETVDGLCAGKDRDVVVRFLNQLLMWVRDASVLLQGGEVINLDQHDDLQKFIAKFPRANLIGALAAIEKAISLVERNVYINLVMLQLTIQLRRSIAASASAKPAGTTVIIAHTRMSEAQRILVTAALPYANGPIHLGHLAGAYLPSDMYVRYQRLKKREIVFICGSDEHGVPITLTADREGITPQAVVDRYHSMNKAAFEKFGMSFDNYSRTSLALHHTTAVGFFLDFHARGILKEKQEKQFYDEQAQMFLPDRYVEGACPVCGNPEARGDQCEKCGSYLNPTELINPRSKITGNTPVVRETSHMYFPLGQYQQRLEAYVQERDKRDGWKDNVLNYCKSWFKDGLQDRAVTRDLDWGVRIPLKGYESKVLYVWFDAVLGYISSTKEWSQRIGKPDQWKRFWLDDRTKYVAFIGKDNVVFHCIVFPSMLMAWNDAHDEKYVLPENVPANEFLNFEGQKFSKSRNIGIDVQDFLAKYPVDPLRYYLAVSLPEYRDSDFYWRDFQAKTNNELADILGNFVNRTLAFADRTFGGIVPPRGALDVHDRQILDILNATPGKTGEYYEHYRFRDGLLETMNLARAANKYFNDSEPWKTAKSNRDRCATTINISIQIARALAVLMEPVIPFSCERIWKMLSLEGDVHDELWDSAGELHIPEGHKLGTPEILFTKIEDTVIEQELKNTGEPVPAIVPVQPKPTEAKPIITIDDFKKIDLRVAKVVQCENILKSERLLKLQVEVGTEKRQILAGIAQHYKPEDLIGKSVVVVFNLQPAKMMGQESQGMLLAASDSNGKLVFVAPSAEIESGSTVK